MYKILFPHEPFDKKNVDSVYLEEYNICKLLGIDTYFFDYDKFIEEEKLSSNIKLDDECILIYRGWMMKPEQYTNLYNSIIDKSNGKIKLINNSTEYKNCHCFPNIYKLIEKYTPKMVMVDNHDILYQYKSILKFIDYDFFIKDHVKSIKNKDGVEKINKNITCPDLLKKVNDFIKERGNLFTGGIVLKQYVNLKKIHGLTNEWRTFFLNGKLISTIQNSYLNTSDSPSIDLINQIGVLLKHKSNFFTVDFAQLEDDSWIVIETGDGQVSGFPEDYNPIGFYNKINDDN